MKKLINKIILVAEDEKNNFKLIQEILEEAGAIVIWSKDGEDAVFTCRTNDQINLVLMDIKMPKLNGFEATSQIKQFRNKLPIIVQTAYAKEFEKDELMRTNFDGFLSKPFKKKDLLSIVEKFF